MSSNEITSSNSQTDDSTQKSTDEAESRRTEDKNDELPLRNDLETGQTGFGNQNFTVMNSNDNESRCPLCNNIVASATVENAGDGNSAVSCANNILETFIVDYGTDMTYDFNDTGDVKKWTQCLCENCQQLCVQLSKAKDMVTNLIDEMSDLLNKSRKFPFLRSKHTIVNRLFSYEEDGKKRASATISDLNKLDISHHELSNTSLLITSDSSLLGGPDLEDHSVVSSPSQIQVQTLTPEKNDNATTTPFANVANSSNQLKDLSPDESTQTMTQQLQNQMNKIVNTIIVASQMSEVSSKESIAKEGGPSSQEELEEEIKKKFICEICGLSYRHKRALNVHIALHRGESKFQCQHCQKVFTQKAGLQRHLPIHTGEMSYQCEECGKRFLYHTSFNVHKLIHSGEKHFECLECGLSFFSSSHLRRHSKTHTGLKPHQCKICSKSFSEKYNLQAHMKIHTGSKKFSCSFCAQGFNRKEKLNQHIAQIHSNKGRVWTLNHTSSSKR